MGESDSLFREPDAGNLHVRFDERAQETGPGQTGLRRVQRKPNPTATGRLKSLRLFSTLLHTMQPLCVLPPSISPSVPFEPSRFFFLQKRTSFDRRALL